MKAKLIKRSEMVTSGRRNGSDGSGKPTKNGGAAAKTTTEVVKGWVGERQKAQQSARQAFTSLFAEAQMRRAT
jgi:hypothetical protein